MESLNNSQQERALAIHRQYFAAVKKDNAISGKISGVYSILAPDGKVYVGASVDIRKRWAQYRRLVNAASQKKLYASLMKFGLCNHTFNVLEICPPIIEILNEREAHWGHVLNALEGGLNSLLPKSKEHNYPVKSSDALARFSDKMRGRSLDRHVIEAARKRNTGRKNTEEAKRRMGEASVGRKASLLTIQKKKQAWVMMSASQKARLLDNLKTRHDSPVFSPQHCARISASKCKPVIDLATGVFYDSVSDAAANYKVTISTMTQRLQGKRLQSKKRLDFHLAYA